MIVKLGSSFSFCAFMLPFIVLCSVTAMPFNPCFFEIFITSCVFEFESFEYSVCTCRSSFNFDHSFSFVEIFY